MNPVGAKVLVLVFGQVAMAVVAMLCVPDYLTSLVLRVKWARNFDFRFNQLVTEVAAAIS